MSPGCLSFAKLVMMSSAPAKSAGGARYAINVVPYNLDSNLYQECVLSTSDATSIIWFLHRDSGSHKLTSPLSIR